MDWKRDIVVMKGGRMIMMINGEMLLMEKDMFTADGIMVQTDGTLIMPDETTRVLLENEAVIIDLVTTRMAET